MQSVSGQPLSASDLSGLKARRDALRQAAHLPNADVRPALEAALAELDAAVDALTAAQDQQDGSGDDTAAGALHAERRLLRATFQDAPVPLFLVEPDGTVRRINRAAGELLDTGTGYATGKPFTAFVNLPSRAAVQTQLAAAARTGTTKQIRCELLTAGGTRECELTAGVARLRGDADRIIIAARDPGPKAARAAGGKSRAGAGKEATGTPVISAITRRMDLVTAVTRLLLENATQNEAVTLQRCARLLASELAAWVIVDVARGHRVRRQFVTGPQDSQAADLARELTGLDPEPGSVPATVFDSGSSQLIAHADDAELLGHGPGGAPVLMLLEATSVLSVPVTDGERTYGALTLARRAGDGPFDLADLGLVEELGEQLALAIKVDRMVRQHTETAAALRGTLLPLEVPTIPGVELATTHVAATDGPGMGGDFYDVYRTPAGWGISIGDVCGRGEGVAAACAAARHAIRVSAHTMPDPTQVLANANEIALAEEFGGRFVTALAAHLEWRDTSLRLRLGSAGHLGPVLVSREGQAHQMKGGGLPLGIFPEAELGTEQRDLSPGDVLVFFTDGLADARHPAMGDFGDRLTGEIAALAGQRPAQLLGALRQLALEFSRGELRDDITMLALRVSEPPDPGR